MSKQPATPLPWEHDSDTPSRNGSPRAMVFPVDDDIDNPTVVAGGIKPENAAYIVHSANAYPRLVEALRKAHSRISDECSSGIDNPTARDIYALLGELGELVVWPF